jgi:L-fucose mutarotase
MGLAFAQRARGNLAKYITIRKKISVSRQRWPGGLPSFTTAKRRRSFATRFFLYYRSGLGGNRVGGRPEINAMLRTKLIHPQILAALGRAGHGSRVLISDGNYPHATARGPNAEMVFLNLAPGTLGVCEVLKALITAIPIEQACVMQTLKSGPYAMASDPDIWAEFRSILESTDCGGELLQIERFAFYEATRQPDVCLIIATGEQRIYANLLLTIGVVR